MVRFDSQRWLMLFVLIALPAMSVRAEDSGEIDFARDIRPVLSENCFYCHGPDDEHREADLRLDLREHAFADRDGLFAIVAGNLEESQIWDRISTDDESILMPPPDSHKKLSPEEVALIKKWIESGAEWSDHWSFVAPEKAEVPDGVDPIDYLVRQRLQATGLTSSEQADPVTLVRRLHFDLTGLPPEPAKVHEFLTAYERDAEGAYVARVDELLASPHFGERMALMWLDAARYGDTSVMHADGPRTMWPWRDWVVKAYNSNKPFSEFSIEQIAGDLMPNATIDQKVASGFNRNHPTSDEGGAIPEELRIGYVVDRVATTANVWMGLTMECAQCHDHKYDPISRKDYYRFFAFFNNHSDPGFQTRRGNQTPVVRVDDPMTIEQLAQSRRELASAITQAGEAKQAASANDKFTQWLSKQTKAGESASTTAADASSPVEAEQPLGPMPTGLAHWFPLTGADGANVWDHATGMAAFRNRGKRETIDGPTGKKTLRLNGGTEYTAAEPVVLRHDQPFTFSAWIQIDGGTTGAIFSSMDSRNKHRGYDFWVEGKRVGTHIINEWPGNAIKVISETELTDKTWHHIVVVYDGSMDASKVKIWIDGEPSGLRISQNGLTKTVESKALFRIGARSNGDDPNGTTNLKASLQDVRLYRSAIREDQLAWTKRDPLPELLALAPEQRSDEQRNLLLSSYLVADDTPFRKLASKAAQRSIDVKKAQNFETTSMIMADLPADKMRPTFMLDRGQYDQPLKDEEFKAGVPAVFPPMAEDAPQTRLGLAQWLFRDDHPLTARVAVNQIWQLLIGHGLVDTPRNFGAQGSFPSHVKLLDWLAVDFRENGWDVKRLVRQIIMSETYRQSSHVSEVARKKDPGNKWLARADRYRLQAELVRDNALAVSGLLNRKMGGAGVKPYQPPGLWVEVGLSGKPKFVQDHGDKLYRRSIYTYFKRSAPPPSMVIFDAPNREACTMKRSRTNTPLQALVTLNDVQFVEAARFLAQRMMRDVEGDPEAIAKHGFELVTLRQPDPNELTVLMGVFDASLETYKGNPAEAEKLLSFGEMPRDANLPLDEHASWTIVASLLLNLDETLNRE